LREAFANIYAEVAQERMARALGDAVPAVTYPTIEEGAHTMAFIEACVASHAKGGWVDVVRAPTARSAPRQTPNGTTAGPNSSR
jgi:hypothetical protein